MTEKKCYAVGCPRSTRTDKLFCFYCWGSLSKATQQLIYDTWAALQKAGFRSDPERRAYLAARVAAVRELRGRV